MQFNSTPTVHFYVQLSSKAFLISFLNLKKKSRFRLFELSKINLEKIETFFFFNFLGINKIYTSNSHVEIYLKFHNNNNNNTFHLVYRNVFITI